jgi:FKBP-type peptidyl-prolyl cis-trans isomerase 2/predicted Fe-Mo cluster-binding NifX family protein
MLIAIPSDAPGGLGAAISEHFGHCGAFTLVAVGDGEITEVSVLENAGHAQGGCMAPVQLLKEQGVEILLAGGMGQRPLSGFQQVGIAVHFKEDAQSVRDAVQLFLSGECRAFGEAQTCGGGGGECGDHQHGEVQREPIVGAADIRDGRVVTLDFELTDSNGDLLYSSSRVGPMQYLHGAGQLLPALESAVSGLEEGANKVIEITCADAFGERNEDRIVDSPREKLPPDVKVGDMVTATDRNGQNFPLTIIHLDETTARLDGNHPLAGKDVVFNITVLKVENATAEEIAHSHVH